MNKRGVVMYETLLILMVILGVFNVFVSQEDPKKNFSGFFPAHKNLIREMFYQKNQSPILALQEKRSPYDGKIPKSIQALFTGFSIRPVDDEELEE